MKRKERLPSQLSESLDKRLTAYALAASAARPAKAEEHPLALFHYAAGTAGLGLLALAQPAQAKVVYTRANVVIGSYVPLDLNHDGKSDFSLNRGMATYCRDSYRDCYGAEWLQVSAASFQGRNRILGKSGIASVLPAGMSVGPKNQFSKADYFMGSLRFHRSSRTQAYKYYGPWINDGKGVKNQYLGLRFLIKGKPHYGWARLTVSGSKGSIQASLSGYAYETIANKAIVTGKTRGPEIVPMGPATLGHLARGASAVSVWRRRQTPAASQ